MSTRKVTTDDVLKLTKPTSMFMCPLTANVYNIEFLKFTIRDFESKEQLFQVQREPQDAETAAKTAAQLASLPPEMEAAVRSVRYNFPSDFLERKIVGSELVFSVGAKLAPQMRMIERHYFHDTLIKSFDFSFGPGIPNSTNSWDAIYDMPALTEELKKEIVNHPFETRSDSFYFAGGELIMHNKAEYAFNLPPKSQVSHGSKATQQAAADNAVKK